MDFSPVPAGTLPPQALTLRGPDPDLELAAGDDFISTVGNALGARNIGGGARRAVVYSSTSGILSGFLFSNDGQLLASELHRRGPSPAKLRAAWLWFVANGMPTTPQDTKEFLANGEAVLATVDLTAIPPALMVSSVSL